LPRRGIYIVRKTKHEIVEMINMWPRWKAWRRGLPRCGRRMRDCVVAAHVRSLSECDAAEHIEEYSEANIAFHQAIVQLSKSQIIFDTIKNIFVHVRAIRKMTISQSDRRRGLLKTYEDYRGARGATPNWSRGWCASIRLIAAFVEANCDFLD